MGGKASLILVLGFAFTLGYISLNMNRLASRSTSNMAMYNEITTSHNLAVAGANVGLSMLYQSPGLRGLLTDQSLNSGAFQNGRFVVRIDSVNPSTLRLRSVSRLTMSTSNIVGDTVEVFFSGMTKQTFTLFAYMSNFQSNSLFWITGDTIWGRTHTNGKLSISGSPVFMGKVTATNGFNKPPGTNPNHGIFKQGWETGTATIQFPNDLSEIATAAGSAGRWYGTNDIWVQLDPGTGANNDGWAYVYNAAGWNPANIIDSVDLSDPGFNGVIASAREVHVKGTLDGALTVSSTERSLWIEDNVLNEKHPNDPTTDDILGLVSEKDIVIVNNAANNSDCEIHGSLFSRKNSLIAQNYNTRGVCGDLRIVGSIVEDHAGATGTFHPGPPPVLTNGFHSRFTYDDRLNDNNFRPPFYPGFWTHGLQVVNWWESIRIPEFY